MIITFNTELLEILESRAEDILLPLNFDVSVGHIFSYSHLGTLLLVLMLVFDVRYIMKYSSSYTLGV